VRILTAASLSCGDAGPCFRGSLFGLTLFVALLLSDLAERSVLSTSVVFLLAGLLVGPAGIDVVHLSTDAPVVREIATLGLFSTLFTDGMRVGLRELMRSWQLPTRALLLGFPLVVLGTAFLAHARSRRMTRFSCLLRWLKNEKHCAPAIYEEVTRTASLRQKIDALSGGGRYLGSSRRMARAYGC
jgi:hypothetical protein